MSPTLLHRLVSMRWNRTPPREFFLGRFRQLETNHEDVLCTYQRLLIYSRSLILEKIRGEVYFADSRLFTNLFRLVQEDFETLHALFDARSPVVKLVETEIESNVLSVEFLLNVVSHCFLDVVPELPVWKNLW